MSLKISEKEKKLLIFIVLLAACALLYNFGYLPLATKVEILKIEATQAEADFIMKNDMIAKESKIKKELNKLQELPDFRLEYYTEDTNQEQFIYLIHSFVESSGVYLQKLAFVDERYGFISDEDKDAEVVAPNTTTDETIKDLESIKVDDPKKMFINWYEDLESLDEGMDITSSDYIKMDNVEINFVAKDMIQVLKFVDLIDKNDKMLIANQGSIEVVEMKQNGKKNINTEKDSTTQNSHIDKTEKEIECKITINFATLILADTNLN